MAILILGLATGAAARAEVHGANHWFAHADSGKWCAYANRKAWRTATTDSFASARIVNGQVQAIEIFDSDETGDWRVFTRYTFLAGKIDGAEREYRSVNYTRTADRYVLRDAKMVRVSRRYLTEDDKPVAPKDRKHAEDGGAYIPVYARLDAMPFFRVAFEKPAAGKVCRSPASYTPVRNGANK